eukprot:TRINITY_DN33877_c0_g1_i1.p1 TRINITY_DN33877_c0_g1~~TRINITY_DN33877_c0_g1_i1.p1  ORF type:complete len:160 (+),score=24.43 TRINITY_DN33877_c0_g1_i1:37-480(+)
MIPPTYRRVARTAVGGIGGQGWSAYRRVLRQVHKTFEEDYGYILMGRNEARKAFMLKRNVSGDDLRKCVEEADATIAELVGNVAPVYDDKGDNRLKLSQDQLIANKTGAAFYSPHDLEKEQRKAVEQDERAVKGQRLRSYKAKVKCV